MVNVDAAIETVFTEIAKEIPGMYVEDYSASPGKIGLRLPKRKVVLTYNSYRRGWLDTRADLGPKLMWFCFKPTPTKPKQYWASELPPEAVKAIFEAHRREIISVLRAAHVSC